MTGIFVPFSREVRPRSRSRGPLRTSPSSISAANARETSLRESLQLPPTPPREDASQRHGGFVAVKYLTLQKGAGCRCVTRMATLVAPRVPLCPAVRTRPPDARRARLRVVAEAPDPSPLNGKKSKCLPLPITQPQSYMWLQVRQLRPSTAEEATCEPRKDACSLERIAMKYDEKCVACGGTGLVKTRSFATSRNRRRRSTAGRCLLCAGVGYVRITTVRVEPDFTKDDSMPADYDPHGFGFPKGEEGPFCDVDKKYSKRNRWFGKGKANPR